MKTLLILRHAKSGEKHSGMPDHDRPLNDRGERDAPRVGALLRDEDLMPDSILSSTAVRAVRTARMVARAAGFAGEIETRRSLYLARPESYLEALRELGDAVSRAMVVGHNPGLEDLVAVLSGQHQRLPTAALVQIALPLDSWADLSVQTSGRLINVWRPKEDLP
jgi:phosphohistidine phosphatase